MNRRLRRYSIRLKLMAVYMVLLIVMALLLFLFFAFRFDRVYRKQADSHMADITDVSTANIEGMIDQIDQLSVSILIDGIVQQNLQNINSRNSANNEKNEAAISAQVRGSVFNIDGIISLRIYPVNGEEIFVGTTNREYMEYSLTSEEIYRAGGAALWGIAGEEHYLCLGRAILSTEDMQPLGYMVIICKNEYLGDQLASVPGSYASRSYLADEEGTVIASGDAEAAGMKFPYTAQELREEQPRTVKDPVSGEDSYYYIGESLENDWTMITTVSTEHFRNGIIISLLQTALVAASTLLISFAVTLTAIRRLMAPTESLLKSMSAFGKGQLDARVHVKAADEIGQISEAYNQMADNIQNLMEKVYLLELANKEAEIENLKMQINPHFLYNTLDTISWLGYTGGNEKITEISVSLARLLRASIKRADMVTVEEELQTVECYLILQSVRFADKFTVEKEIDERACGCYMPSFLLQPLIENSIIHGLEGQIEKGRLKIAIGREGELLCFSISDDGKGMDKEQLESLKKQCTGLETGRSIGLANVYRRLWLLYGEACRFELWSAPGEGTRISFCIPVKLKKEDQNED